MLHAVSLLADGAETRALLLALAPRIRACHGPLPAKSIATMVGQLQSARGSEAPGCSQPSRVLAAA